MNEPSNIEGLYVHVPFCDGKCAYCAFYSTVYAPSLADDWLQALAVEAGLLQDELGRIHPATVYFGGGTPSLLTERQLERLIRLLRDKLLTPDWEPREEAEWSVEANPGTLTPAKLELLKMAGVNRISLGVQSFHDDVLMSLGRRHGVGEVMESVESIRRTGFLNWGLDLIACVPGVGESKWQATLQQAVALGPKHVSVYALTSEEGAELTEWLRRGDMELLDDDRQLVMLNLAETVLVAAGYGRYEISNYAKPGFECRHHLDCWRGRNYLGIGCAAASRVGRQRWSNPKDLSAYLRATEAGRLPERELDVLTPEIDATERLVFGLRMAEGVDLAGMASATGCGDAVLAMWLMKLGRLAGEGLVRGEGRVWRLTRRGREVADYVAVELMP